MQSLLRHQAAWFFALLVYVLLGACPVRGQSAIPYQPQCADLRESPGLDDAKLPDHCYEGSFRLRGSSWEMGRYICSYDDPEHQKFDDGKTCIIRSRSSDPPGLLEQLLDLTDRCGADATRAFILRQEIADMVLATSLQVDGFVAQIDSETAHIRAVHDNLTDIQDAAVSRSALGSAAGSAGGAASSALGLAARTAITVGNWVGAMSGAFGATFNFLGYLQARSPGPEGCFPARNPNQPQRKKCEELSCVNGDRDAPRGCSPTMLYQLFKDEPAPRQFHSDYDAVIEAYLSERKARLISGWMQDLDEDLQSIRDPAKRAKERERKLSTLTARNDSPLKLSVDDLSDRSSMLDDLRAEVSLMKGDLSRLTDDLARGLRCSSRAGN